MLTKRRSFLRERSALALLLAVALLFLANPSHAFAHDPPETDGPWLEIEQLHHFENEQITTGPGGISVNPLPNSLLPASGELPNPNYRYDEEQETRRFQCYYQVGPYDRQEPETHWVSSIWLMLNCRIGSLVGIMTWAGVGIAMMTFAWGGLMWVVDSGTGGERMDALRNMITGPVIGLLLLFSTYAVVHFLQTVIQYNWVRYLAGLGNWSTP